jgi:hypothetical protein
MKRFIEFENRKIIFFTLVLLFAVLSGFINNETEIGTATQTKASVKTTPVKNITAGGADSGYSITVTGGTITKHGICLGKGPAPTTAGTVIAAEKGPGPSFNVHITGLAPKSKYYIRSFVVTNEGNTVYGNEISFLTLAQKK